VKFNDFISPDFKKKYIGLVLDNTSDLKKVYTATFPDLDILEKLIRTRESDILLFSHHAMGYDPTMIGFPFYDIPEEYLLKLKQQRISFYVMHLPLDKNGEYSTSVNLAKHLKLEIIDEFCEYEGFKCGVICKTEKRTVTELKDHMRDLIGHKIKLIMHGNNKIPDGRLAITAGGGSVGFAAKELVELGINMYITGNTRYVPEFEPIMEFHRIIKEKE
jgi:putative NIF3 family GTP cyclohydrolase 1 type 2